MRKVSTKNISIIPSDFTVSETYINNLIQDIVAVPKKRKVRHVKVVDESTPTFQDTILTPHETEMELHHFVEPVITVVPEIMTTDQSLPITTFEVPVAPVEIVEQTPILITEVENKEKIVERVEIKETKFHKAWTFFKKIFTEFAKPYPR